MLWWILVVVVPLQAALSLQLKASGPSHAHLEPDVGGRQAHTPAQPHPEGFEWASSSQLRTTPSTERILASLRGKVHGSLNGFKSFAGRGHAGVDVYASAHADAHSKLQRHHHGSADNTVLLDPLDSVDSAREAATAQGQLMAWAPPGQTDPLRATSPSGTPVPPAAQQWRSHVPSRLERPPCV